MVGYPRCNTACAERYLVHTVYYAVGKVFLIARISAFHCAELACLLSKINDAFLTEKKNLGKKHIVYPNNLKLCIAILNTSGQFLANIYVLLHALSGHYVVVGLGCHGINQ